MGGELDGAGRQSGRRDDVVAGEPIDDELVRGGVEPGDVYRGGKAEDGDPAGVTDDLDHVVAGSPVNGDLVRCAVADARAGGGLEVDIDHRPVRSAQVVDVNGVGAAQRVDLDVLDAVEVHGDVGDIAGEPRPGAVGRDVDALVDVGAVEPERVGARLPLDLVAGVARVPDERVVARAEQRHVVAGAADDDIVAPAAGDGVVAGAAVDREIDLAGVKRRSVDVVVAGKAVDVERVVGPLGAGDRHFRRQPVDDHRCAAAGDGDAVVAGGAIDGHAVGRSVALAASRRCRQIDGDLLDVGSGEIVDRDGVGATSGVDLDVLDAVEVHGDVADVAGKPRALAV